MIRSSSVDRINILPPIKTTKNITFNRVESIYVHELERYKWQIQSYLSKKRERWYERLGPSKEEVYKHHENVSLLRDYKSETKLLEKQKFFEQKKTFLIQSQEILDNLIVASYDTCIVQLINEVEEKQKEKENLEKTLRSLKEAQNLSIRCLEAEQTLLQDLLECKTFVTTVSGETHNTIESVDMELIFDQFEQSLKNFVAETSMKNVEIQKLTKILSVTVKHWILDVEDLKKRRNVLLSQISKEEKRLTWLKETLANLSSR